MGRPAGRRAGFYNDFDYVEIILEKNLGGIYAGRGSYEDYQPLQDQLYFSQAKIIKELADHYRYYTDQKWGNSFNYHLCLDSSIFGIEKCVSIIEDAYRAMHPVS